MRRAPHANDAPHRVVIVGGGFGGLYAAKALKRAPVEITLVDRANHHLFQPLLYQVATGILTEGEIAPPLRGVLRRQRNARVLLAVVGGGPTGVELAGQIADLAHRTLRPDYRNIDTAEASVALLEVGPKL